MKTHIVVVAGGVISGVGKGVATASIGRILQEHGFNVTLIKIDPYINYDAGTLRPTEHGEVWVTNDGGEIDQDLGTYERFLNKDIPKKNNITTGQIYHAVIQKERHGKYLGQTVQFIPHIVDEIKERIWQAAKGYDFAVVELGGTVGDYENVPFLFALKAIEREISSRRLAYILVTYLPVPSHIYEMKTKPTQQAIRSLGQEGIQPDFIICRANQPLDQVRKKKIEVFANIATENIFSAPDLKTIYQMPLLLEEQGMAKKLLRHFNIPAKKEPDWTKWKKLVTLIEKPKKKIQIAIVGKYLDIGDFSLTDSYVSIYQALVHAAIEREAGVSIGWINAQEFEKNSNKTEELLRFDGVVIPGGFGSSGVEGKIKAIEFVRKNNIPFLGLCYGLHLAVVEFARNVCGWHDAHTAEVDKKTTYPVIDILPIQKDILETNQYGGTMRLGDYTAQLTKGSRVAQLYNKETVTERHRHRYEVNPKYVPDLEKNGLIFSGKHIRKDGEQLMEFLELPHHPFFIASQAHPEFKSRLGNPNPIFFGFVQACLAREKVATTVQKKHKNTATRLQTIN